MSLLNKKKSQSPLDEPKVKTRVEELAAEGAASSSIADRIEDEFGISTSERSVSRALDRWGSDRPQGFEQPGTQRSDNEATLIGAPTATSSGELQDHAELMKERGFNPEEWEVTNAVISEYEGSPVKLDQEEGRSANRKYRQLKIYLKRSMKHAFPKPADRLDGKVFTKPKPRQSKDGKLVVFTGDQQAPYHDVRLHNLFCDWLADNQPTEGVLIGDTVDFPDISRHRLNPEGSARVQECINGGYEILRDYVEASPGTSWTKLAGNHDERIRNTLIDWTVELYGIKRAETSEQERSVLSVAHLLRLDELGIDFLEPAGGYQHCQVNVSPYLAARHGWLASKGSGTSALKTLEHLGYSIVVGHTHRQSLVHKTSHDINGLPSTLTAVETGCMCKIQDGLGYAVAPDWQNGFATAHVWGDGRFKLDLATYVSDTLMWRNQRFS